MVRATLYKVATIAHKDDLWHPCGDHGARRMRPLDDQDGQEAEEALHAFLHSACYEENLHPETRAGAGVAYAAQKSMPRRR